MVKIDEFVIDELVAGNLNGESYRRVLTALDAQPDGWKDCALAFLQEQALTRDLKSLAIDDSIWRETSAESRIAHSADQGPSELGAVGLSKVDQRSDSDRRLEWMSRMTSIAAMLLISFTVGWFGSGLARPFGSSNTAATGTSPNVAVVENGPDQSQEEFSPGGLRGNFDPSNMQFVGEQMMRFEQTPRELEDLYRRGMIDLESYGGFVPVYEEDSVQLVPVQHYRVRPKVFSY